MLTIIDQFIRTIRFLVRILKDGTWCAFKDLKGPKNAKMIILANGPSLRDFEEELSNNLEKYSDCEFFALNDFANGDLFTRLKPKHYVLSDPMFFRETIKKDRGLRAVHSIADKVDWDMNFYLSYYWRHAEYLPIIKANKHIKLCFFHAPLYDGLPSLRNFFFKIGWGNGEHGTVVLNAIYASITMNYKEIELYGVDHTFFSGLCVNQKNQLCYAVQHSFEELSEPRPIEFYYDDSMKYMDLCYFLRERYFIFRGHKEMQSYADYMGAHILNCTKNSLIDAYPRKQ